MVQYECDDPAINEFTVVSWNILLDKTRTTKGLILPQAQRLPSLIETLRDVEIDLDVVAIQEAQGEEGWHNGEVLARQLGFRASFWREHNTSKRRGDHIGMFGSRVDTVDFFDLGHDKLGAITHVGAVAITGCHLRNENVGSKRTDQTRALLKAIEHDSQAVVLGDFNATPLELPRRLLREAGFRSAFAVAGKRSPKTWPTPAYRQAFYPKRVSGLVPSVGYDDIYVRGLDVEWARTFTGDSDHKGLAARVKRL